MSTTTTNSLPNNGAETLRLQIVSGAIEFYIQPILVLLGVVGNILSFVILSQPSYKGQSTCVYMKGLAISDSIFLVFSVVQRTVISIKKTELRFFVGFKWVCAQYLFWQYYAGTISAMLLQVMSAERLVAMLLPLKAKTWCNVQKAKRIVLSLFVVPGVIMLPLNLFRERQAKVDGWLCPFHFDGNLSTIHDQVISALIVYIPFITISLSNIGIVLTLKIGERRRERMTSATKTTTSNQIIRMLIIVSTAFIVPKLPNAIRRVYWSEFWLSYTGVRSPHLIALRRFSVTLSNMFDISNYALNTYFYIFSVRKFRKEARRLLC